MTEQSGQPLAGRRIAEVLATSTGGVGSHLRSVLPALGRAGALVRVCGPRPTEQLFGFAACGAVFRPVGISAGISSGGAPVADLRAVLALRRATAGADLVHAHGLRAGLVAAAARRLAGERARPLVITLHNALPGGGGLRRRVLQVAERATIRGADVVLAASADLAANARRLGARDVRVAPVAAPQLPPARRGRAQVRRELGLDDDSRPLVVAIGRLHPQKGYDVLLDAAARWATRPRPPLVVIAGDGPLEQSLAGQIAARRLPITLLGRRNDVADLLGAADVCVLTSVWEARSLTAQEALRAGTPLVATRVGGIPELVGTAADLVPAGDARALADAVIAVLADPERAARLGAAGPAQAAGWPDEAATARQLVALYRELLGPPGRDGR